MSSDVYIDPTVRRLPLRFWLTVGAVLGLLVAGLYLANRFLFPAEAAGLDLSGLEATGSTEIAEEQATSTPTTASTVEKAEPSSHLVTSSDGVTGFQVAHPSNWSIRSHDGIVLIRSDDCGSTSVIFAPVTVLDNELTGSTLLASVASPLLGQFPTLTLGSSEGTADTTTQSLLSGTACGTEVTGQAQLTQQGNRALLKLFWYPASREAELSNTVTSILRSYKSKQSTAIASIEGDSLALPVPTGWVFEQTDLSASAHTGDQEVRQVLIDFSVTDPLETALSTWLKLEQDSGRELASLQTDDVIEQSADDADGRRWNSQSQVLTFTRGGVSFQGILTAAYTDFLGNRALIRWRAAPTAVWSQAEPLLQLIERGGRITINDTTLRPPSFVTASDTSVLTGQSFRTTFQSQAANQWRSELLELVELHSTDNKPFIAYSNARNPTTAVYETSITGAIVNLEPTVATAPSPSKD